ncbi:MAG: helix-turn-helix transcriptional regulator [Pseudomonadota bacterium]|nr:helix-turn-helix transcriptional regulator [Pseudomonadota bacterium]
MIDNDVLLIEKVKSNLLLNCDDVCRICQPLFQNSPITYFEYSLYYDTGEAIALTSYPDLGMRCYNNSMTPRFDEFKLMSLGGLKLINLSHDMPLVFTADYLRDRYENNIAFASDDNIYHRLYFVERRSDHYMATGFGTRDSSKAIQNFYLNATPFLENFIRYFEHHAEEMISSHVQTKRIMLPDYFDPKIMQSINLEPAFSMLDLNFPIEIPSSNPVHAFNITKREEDCLLLIAQGYTMKNAARKLDISPRTVEMHLRNLKEKHGVYTRNELVDLWHHHCKK